MLKHLTLVTSALLMLIFLTPVSFANDDVATGRSNPYAGCTDREGDAYFDCIERVTRIISPRQVGSCPQATQNRDRVRNEFSGSCPGSGFTSSGGGSGHFACSRHVACCIGIDVGSGACNDIRSQYSDQEGARGLDAQFSSFMEQLSNAADPQQASQLQQQISQVNLQRSYNQCPMRSDVGRDEAFEDAEEARNDVEEKELALVELQEQLTQAQNELQANLDAIQNDKEELDADTQRRLQEIEQALEEENEEILAQIMALQQQLLDLQAQETNYRHELQVAQQGYRNTIRQLESDCHNRALERVQAERSANLELAAQGMLTAELQTVFQSVGSSTYEDMQRQVEEEYQNCKRDPDYGRAVESANDQLQMTTGQLNDAINALAEPRRMINEQIAQYQTEERSEALRRNMRLLSQLNSEYERGMNALERRYENEMRTGQTRIASLQQQIMVRQRHLASAQQSMAYKQSIADMRRQYSSGGMATDVIKLLPGLRPQGARCGSEILDFGHASRR